MVEASEMTIGRVRQAGDQALVDRIGPTLTKRFGADTRKLALTVRATEDNAPIIRWALENDVPVVLSSVSDTAEATLKWLASLERGTTSFFHEAVTNPAKLALVHNIRFDKYSHSFDTALANHADFAPLWAIADEGMAIRLGGIDSPFFGWLSRFEFFATASI